jgi:hypothetical protein
VRREGCPWFFSLNGEGPLIAYSRVKDAIQAKAQLNAPWHLHLIRYWVYTTLREITNLETTSRLWGTASKGCNASTGTGIELQK